MSCIQPRRETETLARHRGAGWLASPPNCLPGPRRHTHTHRYGTFSTRCCYSLALLSLQGPSSSSSLHSLFCIGRRPGRKTIYNPALGGGALCALCGVHRVQSARFEESALHREHSPLFSFLVWHIESIGFLVREFEHLQLPYVCSSYAPPCVYLIGGNGGGRRPHSS